MDTTRRKTKSLRMCMWAIIACLLACLSASDKVNALQITQNVEYRTQTAQTGLGNGANSTCDQILQPDTTVYALKICNNTTNVQTGDIVELKISVGFFGQLDDWDMPRLVSVKTLSNSGTASLSPLGVDNSWGMGSNTATITARVNSGGSLGNVVAEAGGAVVARTFVGSNMSAGNTVVWKPTSNDSVVSGIQSTTNAITSQTNQESQWRTSDQESQENANDDASEATDAVSDAIDAKHGLLDLFYDLIQALSSTSASNCNVPFHDPATNSTITINMCQGSGTPLLTFIQTGASILATLWCARAGVAWYHRFVAELNEVSK